MRLKWKNHVLTMEVAMHTINIHEAKTQFSKLVESVSQGEEIIIAKAGKPAAKLVPIQKKPPIRKPGSMKGKIRIASDFNAPLPKDVLALFEGN
jgi:prevent-host-death family protein